MKITCTKKEDLIKERDAYLADKEARQAKYDEQYSKYREAEQREFNEVEKAIRDAIGDTFIEIDIECNRSSFRDGAATVDVRVTAERDIHHTPFSWRWSAKIRDGELVKESSSWSGMDVTTSEDVDYMKEVVRILDTLVNLDWDTLLKRNMPKYGEYVSERDPMYERSERDYDKEIAEATLSEAVGANKLFKGVRNVHMRGGRSHPYMYWYQILRETPKQFEVYEIPDRTVEQGSEAIKEFMKNSAWPEKITKDKLIKEYKLDVDNPIEF